jgi:hypothetical protein
MVCASALQAGDKTDTPAIVVRVKSLNALLDNINLVVKLVGQQEAAQQIEAMIKSKIGKDGIKGVDPARPIGAYVRFGKTLDEVNGAIAIPIADDKAFLALLDNMGVVYKKDKDGIYTHRTNKNIDLYFRFAHQYLFVTSISTESIQDKNLPDPAKALKAPGDATFSIAARVDQIPDDAKSIALAYLDEAIQDARKNKIANETKAQHDFRLALLDDLHKTGKTILRDASDLRFDLDLNEKTKELAVNVTIAGKPDSELAKSIQGLGNLKSPLAGLLSKNAAFQGAVHVKFPEALHKAFAAVLDETAARSLEGIQDAAKKQQADALFKALMPSAKSGEYQAVAAILGPQAGHYTILAAVQLKEGTKLAATLDALIADAVKQMPEAERGKIQLDFAQVGAIKIRRFEVPTIAAADPMLAEIVGDKYVYVAIRDDALFLTMGKDGLNTIKSAVGKTSDVDSPPLVFDIDVARMAKWTARTPEQKNAADKLLAADAASRMRVTVDGGSALTARLQLSLNVLEFLVKTGTAKGK